MKKNWSTLLTVLVAAALVFSSSALAVPNGGKASDDRMAQIREMDIFRELDKSVIAPENEMTFAQGIALITAGLQLDLGDIRFVKEPKASDYFENVPDDAWYSWPFVIAWHHDLGIPEDVDPERTMTREEYTHYLFKAMTTTGSYFFIEMYMMFEDEDQVQDDYMDSIQKMLVSKIASLDKERKFRPKAPVTWQDAVELLDNTLQFVREQQSENPPTEDPDRPVSDDTEVTVTVEAINRVVNQVTLSWGEKPNAGYRLTVDKIDFTEKQAVIWYTKHRPEPGRMYAEMITKPTAVTYVGSEYEIVTRENTSKVLPLRDEKNSDQGGSSEGRPPLIEDAVLLP